MTLYLIVHPAPTPLLENLNMARQFMPVLLAAITAACGPRAEIGRATDASAAIADASPAIVPAAAVDRDLVCGVDGDEAHALLSAPQGAKRMSEHSLAVTYRSGVREFADKKPYGEDLDRNHWNYCGYMPALKAHLVGLQEGDLFTGKLLLEDSGAVLDAGQAVFPAPDGKLFLAAEQENGSDLQRWTVADLAGRRFWVGDSGVLEKGYILIQYENPRWTPEGVLQADATCTNSSATKGLARFTITGGSGRWRTDLRCAA